MAKQKEAKLKFVGLTLSDAAHRAIKVEAAKRGCKTGDVVEELIVRAFLKKRLEVANA